MPIETVNVSFENTHNKQQYYTKITGTEVGKKVMVIRNVYNFLGCFVVLTSSNPFILSFVNFEVESSAKPKLISKLKLISAAF